MTIGNFVKQPEGYKALIPADFPPKDIAATLQSLTHKAVRAERLVGKLDGIAHTLPDADFFVSMFTAKDATCSAQIEGTQATMVDALEMKAGIAVAQTDADDILFYIKALHYGIERLADFPFSLRFIRELHRELMTGARSSHHADPGEFRRSQNWIGGTRPDNAAFVPPPPSALPQALSHLEQFIHEEELVMPMLQAGLIHAQFETIHPFLDGNGRTGRLMITLFLYQRAILERPVLFLSAYFKKHQQIYYDRLNGYHEGKVIEWLDFFLDAVLETATDSIALSKAVSALRERDMRRLQALGKREAESGIRFLQQLFQTPIVTTSSVADMLKFSRPGAQKLIDRFIALGILALRDETVRYGRRYAYRDYVDAFAK